MYKVFVLATPTPFKVWSRLLFIVIVKQSITENWSYPNSKGNVELLGIRGILGIMTSWPSYLPCDVLTYMVLAESLVITHPVPIVTIGDLKIIK